MFIGMGPSVRSLLSMAAAACGAGLLAASAMSLASGPDPRLDDQWALDAGRDPAGVRQAWRVSQGAGVVVAVVDSGVDGSHPELQGALWRNPRERLNGRDDDANGFVDDIHGVNLIDRSGDVTDRDGHGTEVAGVIAARRGNSDGGAGVAPRAQIMAVKVFDPRVGDGLAQPGSLPRAIRYAARMGAKIINVSMSGPDLSQRMIDAVAYAHREGATVVAAAGNAHRSADLHPEYPAAMMTSNVLSVAGTGQNGGLMHGSAWGRRSVQLAAPGEGIFTLGLSSRYMWATGTSMSAPMVSGALALLQAARPDLSQRQLRRLLLDSARRDPQLAGKVSAGALDVGAAMRLLPAVRRR